MKKIILCIVILFLFFPHFLCTDELNKPLYIQAKWVFTGHQVLEDMVICIQGKNIVSLTTVEEIDILPDAQYIDAGNSTVLPGFIDGHVHMTSVSLRYLKNIYKLGWGRLVEEYISFMAENRKYFILICLIQGL